MSEQIEFDPSRGSAEDHLLAARQRLENAKQELTSAMQTGKPTESLQDVVDEYQAQLENLEKDIHEKTMGAAA